MYLIASGRNILDKIFFLAPGRMGRRALPWEYNLNWSKFAPPSLRIKLRRARRARAIYPERVQSRRDRSVNHITDNQLKLLTVFVVKK